MSAKAVGPEIGDGPAHALISDREILATGFRSYERFRFTVGSDGKPQTRDVLRAGRVAAVLPLDLNRDAIILMQQFRVAAHLANGKGNLIEIVAGHIEPQEKPIEAARRECIEEIGLGPNPLIELFTYFTSPGISDEEIILFLGIVDASHLPQRGGAAAEHEETVPMRVTIDAALAALAGGPIHNGLVLTALQWLALNRSRLREIVRTGSARS